MNKNSAITILRWGLAFVFFYAAIASLLRPNDWVGYFPGFLQALLAVRWIISIFAVYEIILAILLFMGRKLVWVSILSAVTLAGIVALNLNLLDVVFRDVGLIFASLALFELERKSEKGVPIVE